MLLSLDVSSEGIFMAEGSGGSGAVTVARAGDIRLPAGTVEDGIVKNHASLVMSVNKLISAKNMKPAPTAVTFNSTAILSRRLELPRAKPREIAKMVKNEMTQVVSDTGEYVYDYTLCPEIGASKTTCGVWAYAMSKEIVDEYYAFFRSIRLKPAALDIHPNSVEKLFTGAAVNGRQVGSGTVLFAGVETDGLEIHLFADGQRVFSRLSPVTSSELRTLLGNAGLSSETGNVFDTVDLTSDAVRGDNIINEAVHSYIGRISDELQKMIQFQLRRDSNHPVSCAYIYGTMACVNGLAQGLGAALGTEVQTIESVSKVKAQNIKIARYINAVGALIRL